MAAVLGIISKLFFGVSIGFKLVGFGLNVSSMVVSNVLKQQIQELIDELQAEQQKLINLGIDIQKGIELFEAISIANDKITWTSQYVDDYVNNIMKEQFELIQQNGDKITVDIKAFPCTSLTDQSADIGPQDWVGMGIAIAQAVVSSGGTFKTVAGILKFRSNPNSPDLPVTESEQANIIRDLLNSRFNTAEKSSSALEQSSNRASKIPPEFISCSAKIGFTFDVLFSFATLGLMIANIIDSKNTEAEIQSKIQEVRNQLDDAKLKAASITKEEAQLVQSLPHFFVYARSKFDAVYQLATNAGALGNRGSNTSDLSLIDDAESFFPFTNDQMTYWRNIAQQLDAIANDATKTALQKEQDCNALGGDISSKYSDEQIISAFNAIGNNFSKLIDILKQAKDHLVEFNNLVDAIQQVKTLIKRSFTVTGIVDLVATLVPGITSADVLQVIAFYALPLSTTYIEIDDNGKSTSHDLVSIRNNTQTIDLNIMNAIFSNLQ